ncbi:uncharacterized protein LOC143862324 [Tasmannia lanceolata]|uniref:uncharacterized protein LOC143862324 n=1 Tax=Tasmannia lanceolata TaxID=3420 RepID=UPI0040627FC8
MKLISFLQASREREREREMGGTHMMKRIPLMKFPQRHPKPAADSVSHSSAGKAQENYSLRTEVPAPTTNAAVGGKASLQPKRRPLSDAEIEAIMLGGVF